MGTKDSDRLDRNRLIFVGALLLFFASILFWLRMNIGDVISILDDESDDGYMIAMRVNLTPGYLGVPKSSREMFALINVVRLTENLGQQYFFLT